MDRDVPDWLDVSRETLDKLTHYTAEALRWNGAINLVSKSSIDHIWQRHVWDSAQLFSYGDANSPWADIGSGGGFPGIVMAIMGAQQVTLVESDQRKAAFLREIARQLSLPVTVLARRVDQIQPLTAKTLTARALAALTELLAHAKPHLDADGAAIFPKGRASDVEIIEAQAKWRFDVEKHPSKTVSDATVLVIRNIQRR
ncbi:MAG: 16S rRNA (guanine(527)-N(7))-methyltransferase RsmG [Cypionkella sp.]|nr:16S rRNA (guanine(527)-N(7))-methyltransferase RsmG [Cypionkella sp.]